MALGRGAELPVNPHVAKQLIYNWSGRFGELLQKWLGFPHRQRIYKLYRLYRLYITNGFDCTLHCTLYIPQSALHTLHTAFLQDCSNNLFHTSVLPECIRVRGLHLVFYWGYFVSLSLVTVPRHELFRVENKLTILWICAASVYSPITGISHSVSPSLSLSRARFVEKLVCSVFFDIIAHAHTHTTYVYIYICVYIYI